MLTDDLTPAQVAAYWEEHDKRTDARIAAALKAFESNYRPKGLTPIPCTIASPVASAVTPAAHIDVPFPCTIVRVTFRAAEVGSAVLTIKVRRPGQVYAGALSIVGIHPPSIVAATDAEVVPSTDWTTNLEASSSLGLGSTVYYFLTSVSGFLSLTINLWVRCY